MLAYWKNNKIQYNKYEDLQEIVQNEENSTNENDNTDILKNETSNISILKIKQIQVIPII